MEYREISHELQDAFNEMLTKHLTTCLPNLMKNKKNGLIPMISIEGTHDLQEKIKRMAKDKTIETLPLAVAGNEEASNAVIGLLSPDGRIDVDEAYVKAIHILKNISFERALFSYSTKAATSDGKMVNAVKSILIDKSGIAIIVFTPYTYTGFLKNKVEFQDHVLHMVIENIFDGKNYN